eukprot:2980916-Pleurochrysis_carterae.AAC.1
MRSEGRAAGKGRLAWRDVFAVDCHAALQKKPRSAANKATQLRTGNHAASSIATREESRSCRESPRACVRTD